MKFVEPGVGCEACHGRENHIIAPLDKKAETIISPDKLPVNASAMICGSCHNQGKDSKESTLIRLVMSRREIPDSYHFAEKITRNISGPQAMPKNRLCNTLIGCKANTTKRELDAEIAMFHMIKISLPLINPHRRR